VTAVETLVWFAVPGTPQPQGSTRAFVKAGKVVTTSANPNLRPWRDSLILAAKEARKGRDSLTGPVGVIVEFYVARPKGHYGKRGLLPSAPKRPFVRPDLDKLIRGVLDALTQSAVLVDDGQVVDVWASKEYGDPETRVAVVTVTPSR
jgi:Holliday junction resolvase RusA-like endonuclease